MSINGKIATIRGELIQIMDLICDAGINAETFFGADNVVTEKMNTIYDEIYALRDELPSLNETK